MKIKTALILCAGFGKRLHPLTSKTPKPLLKIKNITLLERTLNIIKQLEIKNVKINTFHLENEIINFLSNYKSNINIDIIKDGKDILDTGGGIINLIKSSSENDFIVFNPDTIWGLKYKDELEKMIEYYYSNKLNNLLLVVNKNKSFDKLNSSTNLFVENMRNQINYNEKLLESMSYKSVLNRGYSVTKNLKNRVIKSKKDIENDTNIIIETSFAKISAEVKEIKDE